MSAGQLCRVQTLAADAIPDCLMTPLSDGMLVPMNI